MISWTPPRRAAPPTPCAPAPPPAAGSSLPEPAADPGHLEIHVRLEPAELRRLVECAMDCEDHLLAYRLLDAALGVRPHDLDLLSCAGVCLQELHRWPEARDVLRRAADLDFTGNADLELAWAAMTHDDTATAATALARAIRRSPNHLREIHYDAPFWAPIRGEAEVVRAVERAEMGLAFGVSVRSSSIR